MNQSRPQYLVLRDLADDACRRGDKTLTADLCLKSFKMTPTKWSKYRYIIFENFLFATTGRFGPASKKRLKQMQEIAGDKSEPYLYRSTIAMALARHYTDLQESEDCGLWLRECIRLAEKAPDKERKKIVEKIDDDGFNVETTVAEEIDELVQQARFNLTGEGYDGIGSEGTTLTPRKYRYGSMLSHQQVKQLLAIGGNCCDSCGKSTTELGVTHLQCCSRCKMAYYCSEKCNKRQWKRGHKHHCRKPGEPKPGDFVFLHGLTARTDLNGWIMQVVGPAPSKPGEPQRWQVKKSHVGEEAIVSVKLKNIRQLRPLK